MSLIKYIVICPQLACENLNLHNLNVARTGSMDTTTAISLKYTVTSVTSVSLDALISSLSNKLIFKTYNANAKVKNGKIRDKTLV